MHSSAWPTGHSVELSHHPEPRGATAGPGLTFTGKASPRAAGRREATGCGARLSSSPCLHQGSQHAAQISRQSYPRGFFLYISRSKSHLFFQKPNQGTSPAVQGLGGRGVTAGSLGSIPGQGTESPQATQSRAATKKK